MNIRTWNWDKIFVMKSIIKFYVIGTSEIIYKWILTIFFFFLKNYVLKKGKIIIFFGQEIKRKVAKRMHYSEAEIDISPIITLQPEFFLRSSFSLVLLMNFLKIWVIIGFSTMKNCHNNNNNNNNNKKQISNNKKYCQLFFKIWYLFV